MSTPFTAPHASPDPTDPVAPAGVRTLLRALVLTTWGLYTGPVSAWRRFPKGKAFSFLMLLCAVGLFVVDALASGLPFITGLVSLAACGLIMLIVPGDPRWGSAFFAVVALGMLALIPVDTLTRLLGSSAVWHTWPKVTSAVSTLMSLWMLVTILRLSIAKITQSHKDHPMP